ncbi:hypothetical protein TA3x_000368 [Tundrisphaera sp. TA3]|uniref:hypothetical protein n=1 Tax=Tundrisphaera sp. TA3 TaxID=3435775 RepID=UPI003EBED173
MNHIAQQLACEIADAAVTEHGHKLDKMARLKLWSQYHDAILTALTQYEVVMTARRLRVNTMISEN